MQNRFLTEFNRVADALAPWVITCEDGVQWISPEAPAELAALHRRMVCTGYAKGWL